MLTVPRHAACSCEHEIVIGGRTMIGYRCATSPVMMLATIVSVARGSNHTASGWRCIRPGGETTNRNHPLRFLTCVGVRPMGTGSVLSVPDPRPDSAK